jgi:hypothetical protein
MLRCHFPLCLSVRKESRGWLSTDGNLIRSLSRVGDGDNRLAFMCKTMRAFTDPRFGRHRATRKIMIFPTCRGIWMRGGHSTGDPVPPAEAVSSKPATYFARNIESRRICTPDYLH